jgi:AcrR family transcriptional regulator
LAGKKSANWRYKEMVKVSGGFDAFHSLAPERQKRIIEAALKEFADKGFKKASTNTIAAEAQVGKGMLFYYFGSKEELFDFLCEYTIAFHRDKYLPLLDISTGDFLERYVKIAEIKREVLKEYHLHIAFFESFYKPANSEYFQKFQDEISELKDKLIGRIYEKIDYSLFRQDLDGPKTVEYIRWLFDSYQNDIARRVQNGEVVISDNESMEQEWKRYYGFLDDIRKLFYKGL